MSGFKRDSSRFSRGGSSGGSSGGRSNGGSGRGSYNRGGGQQQQQERSYGGSRGSSRGGNGGGNGGGDFKFTRIASLTIPKSATDELAGYIQDELRGSEVKLNAQIYLGKGDGNELVLRNGDQLFISFRTSDKDKDFVVGSISILNG